MNNITEQVDAVMLNFPHLFNFLPVATNDGTTLAGRPTDTARDCSAGQAAPLRESLFIITPVRRNHRDNGIR